MVRAKSALVVYPALSRTAASRRANAFVYSDAMPRAMNIIITQIARRAQGRAGEVIEGKDKEVYERGLSVACSGESATRHKKRPRW